MATKKQRQQQKLWQAIGTVKGFHGYLHNLKHVVLATGKYKEFPLVDALHENLETIEMCLRYDLQNIK